MKIKAIITGTTGMVGEGVLHVCLTHPEVERVLVINRRPCGVVHEKLTEVIHQDFHDLSAIEPQLKGYNACYFCLGVSSIGMKEDQYRHLTYDLTMHVAKTLVKLNPDMTFCYVSGAGTDSSEQGSSMWARVKGKTENDLTKLPFKAVYNFRPGYIQPMEGMNNTYRVLRYISWMYPFFKGVFPKYVISLEEVGKAMVNATLLGNGHRVLECKDIRALAAR